MQEFLSQERLARVSSCGVFVLHGRNIKELNNVKLKQPLHQPTCVFGVLMPHRHGRCIHQNDHLQFVEGPPKPEPGTSSVLSLVLSDVGPPEMLWDRLTLDSWVITVVLRKTIMINITLYYTVYEMKFNDARDHFSDEITYLFSYDDVISQVFTNQFHYMCSLPAAGCCLQYGSCGILLLSTWKDHSVGSETMFAFGLDGVAMLPVLRLVVVM